MKNLHDQKGFSAIEAIVIAVVIALLGIGGWFIYSKQSSNEAKNSSSSSSTNPHTSKDNEENKTDDTTTIKLHSLGIEFTPTDALKDTTFTETTSEDGTPLVTFSTAKLKNLEENEYCDRLGPNRTDAPFHLGMVLKVSGAYPENATDENVFGRLVKQFDGYNIQYREPADYCFVGEANEQQADQQQKELYKALQQSTKAIE